MSLIFKVNESGISKLKKKVLDYIVLCNFLMNSISLQNIVLSTEPDIIDTQLLFVNCTA